MMSLDGGLEELAEFFLAFASSASSVATFAVKIANSRRNDSQFRHRMLAGMSIVPVTYPQSPESTKSNSQKSRERLQLRPGVMSFQVFFLNLLDHVPTHAQVMRHILDRHVSRQFQHIASKGLSNYPKTLIVLCGAESMESPVPDECAGELDQAQVVV